MFKANMKFNKKLNGYVVNKWILIFFLSMIIFQFLIMCYVSILLNNCQLGIN